MGEGSRVRQREAKRRRGRAETVLQKPRDGLRKYPTGDISEDREREDQMRYGNERKRETKKRQGH